LLSEEHTLDPKEANNMQNRIRLVPAVRIIEVRRGSEKMKEHVMCAFFLKKNLTCDYENKYLIACLTQDDV
jgi:hypothetical protein